MEISPERLSTPGLEATGGAAWWGSVPREPIAALCWGSDTFPTCRVPANNVTQWPPKNKTQNHIPPKNGRVPSGCGGELGCLRLLMLRKIHHSWDEKKQTENQEYRHVTDQHIHKRHTHHTKWKHSIHLCYVINGLTEQNWRYRVHRVLERFFSHTSCKQTAENHCLLNSERKMRMFTSKLYSSLLYYRNFKLHILLVYIHAGVKNVAVWRLQH